MLARLPPNPCATSSLPASPPAPCLAASILNAMMVQSLISLRRTVFYRERGVCVCVCVCMCAELDRRSA